MVTLIELGDTKKLGAGIKTDAKKKFNRTDDLVQSTSVWFKKLRKPYWLKKSKLKKLQNVKEFTVQNYKNQTESIQFGL